MLQGPRGIGRSIALLFASEGANVAITDLRIDENALQTEKMINELGVKGKAYASNAALFEETQKVVEQIHKDFGTVDILVNNAGITMDALLLRMRNNNGCCYQREPQVVFNFTKAVRGS